MDPVTLQPLVEQLQSAYYGVEDSAYQLRDYKEGIEFNPQRLAQIEQRLDLLHSLKRKYGETVEDILNYQTRIKTETDQLDNRDELLKELATQEESLLGELQKSADKLTSIRRTASRELARQIEQELAHLQMERSVFEVKLGFRYYPRLERTRPNSYYPRIQANRLSRLAKSLQAGKCPSNAGA